MASFEQDRARIRAAYLRMLTLLTLVCSPLLIGLFVVAPEAITLVYGARWRPSVPLLRIFVVYTLLRTLTSHSSAVWNAIGRPDLGLKLSAVFLPLTLTGIAIGSTGGATGIALGVVAVRVVGALATHELAARQIDLSATETIRAVRSPAILALLVGVSAAAAKAIATTHVGSLGRLLSAAAAGGCVFLVGARNARGADDLANVVERTLPASVGVEDRRGADRQSTRMNTTRKTPPPPEVGVGWGYRNQACLDEAVAKQSRKTLGLGIAVVRGVARKRRRVVEESLECLVETEAAGLTVRIRLVSADEVVTVVEDDRPALDRVVAHPLGQTGAQLQNVRHDREVPRRHNLGNDRRRVDVSRDQAGRSRRGRRLGRCRGRGVVDHDIEGLALGAALDAAHIAQVNPDLVSASVNAGYRGIGSHSVATRSNIVPIRLRGAAVNEHIGGVVNLSGAGAVRRRGELGSDTRCASRNLEVKSCRKERLALALT